MAAVVEVNGFEIVGREGVREFNQWEQNMKLSNPCMKAGDEVVFRNSSGATYVMIAGSDGVEVPNKMLQMTCNILVEHGQGQDSCGDCQSVFAVNPAEKPDDYVFVDNTIRKQEAQSGGGSGGLVVHITGDGSTSTADKTFAEISEAIESGKNVRAMVNISAGYFFLSLISFEPNVGVMFSLTTVNAMGVMIMGLMIDSAGNVTTAEKMM